MTGPAPDPEQAGRDTTVLPMVHVPDPEPARFAQLTYTSFDEGTGRGGGWQVRQTTGDVTPDEESVLVAGIPTQFGANVTVPRLPTAAQIGALPRKLVYAPAGRAAAFWHTALAGTDATGRPGNVFCHVVLDRDPGRPDDRTRPADLLGPAHWLRPFNPDQVLAADLDTVPEPPWAPDPAAGRDAVAGFLVAQNDACPGLLAGLLDAVAAAVEGGPTVVLGVDDAGRGERWIAAVAHLMSPGTGRRFFWSTSERVAGLPTARRRGLHLVLVPRDDADAAAGDRDLAVLHDQRDEHDQPVELGDLNDRLPHHARSGSEIGVTPWSVLAGEVLQDATTAAARLGRLDDTAERAGDRGLSCAWPIAMAVALEPDVFGQAQDEAAQVLAGRRPDGLAAVPEFRARIDALVHRALGGTAPDALPYATGELRDPAVSPEAATSVYLIRAMRDPEWLGGAEPVPKPGGFAVRLGPDVVDAAQRACDDLLAAQEPAGPPGVESAVVALRLVDLVLHYRIPDRAGPAGPRLWDAVTALVDRVAAPVLTGPVQGPALVARVGPVPEALAATVLRPVVGRCLPGTGRRPGERLAPGVLRWLYPSPPPAPGPGAGADRAEPTLVELAVQVTHVVPDPSEFRLLALRSRLGDPHTSADELARLAEAHRFTAAELAGLASASYDLRPIAPALVAALLTVGHDDDLADTLHRLRGGEPDPGRVDPAIRELWSAARLRTLAQRWWATQPGEPDAVEGMLVAAEWVAGGLPADLAPDVRVALMAARVVDVLRTAVEPPVLPEHEPPERPSVDRWLDGVGRVVPDVVVRQLCGLLDNGGLSFGTLVFAALAGAPELTWVPYRLAPVRELAALTTSGPEPEPLLDRVVRARAEVLDRAGVERVYEDVRLRTEHALRLGGHPSPGSLHAELDHVLTAWARRVRPRAATDDGGPRWRQRRR